MSTILVHDLRLLGGTPYSLADRSLEVGAKTPIVGMIQTIISVASTSISRLLIMCHGYESTSTGNMSIPMSMGFGLQLCMEDLTFANLGIMNVLKDCVQNIILYACGPANTAPSAAGTFGDGRRFCSEMAAYTNANVYASDTAQVYTISGKYDPGNLVCETTQLDFGPWEGNIFKFSPDGSVIQL
jgi:hypothetical protein